MLRFVKLTLCLCLFQSIVTAQEITECRRLPQPAGTVNGKQDEDLIDKLVADIPPALAKQIEELTGISAEKAGVQVLVARLSKDEWITSVSGDEFTVKGHGHLPALGIKPWKHDYIGRYVSLVESITDNKIYTYGYFEYNDRVKKKQCYLFCEITGEVKHPQGKVPELTGRARWIGPIKDAKFPKSEEPPNSESKK